MMYLGILIRFRCYNDDVLILSFDLLSFTNEIMVYTLVTTLIYLHYLESLEKLQLLKT